MDDENTDMSGPLAILIVEDVDHKYDEVRSVITHHCVRSHNFTRARTLIEAQDETLSKQWDLVVVDISMDIASAKENRTREAHANLGGLDLIEQMYLMEINLPTVIVTGFDYFVRADRDSSAQEAQTFAELDQQARKWLGPMFLGCIRYGVPGWQERLIDCLERLSL